jgi:hypothetical protein
MENTAAARELGTIVRRHGHLGLHCVVVGGRGASACDLQRRIRSAGFGVGLRTADAVSALDSSRTPAGLRSGAELAVGRGYVVRAGQTLLIQMADPYLGLAGPSSNGLVKSPEASDDDEHERESEASSLDAWVEKLQAKYAGCETRWGTPTLSHAPVPVVSAPLNPRLGDLGELVRRLAQRELEHFKDSPISEPLLLTRLAQFGPETWSDEAALLEFIRAAVVQMHGGNPMSASWDLESVLMAATNRLSEEEAIGVAT